MPAVKSAKPRDPALQERLRHIAETRAQQKAAAESADCKRRGKRKQTTLPGLIMFKSMRTQVPCTIADMSGTGARLTLNPSVARAHDVEHFPAECTLVMRTDRMAVACEIVWRRDASLGVRYLGPPKPWSA
jgi:hypothetical protein